MNYFDFGRLIKVSEKPTNAQREEVVRKALADIHYLDGYLRVHALQLPTATSFYGVVSFASDDRAKKTFVSGSLRCAPRDGGCWLQARCYLATGQVPTKLCCPPQKIMDTFDQLSFVADVDPLWMEEAKANAEREARSAAIRKGNVFVATAGKEPLLAGALATHAVILSKTEALFIAPSNGTIRTRPISLLEHFVPLPPESIRPLKQADGKALYADLVFDLSGDSPILVGRLGVRGAANQQDRARQDREQQLEKARQSLDLAGMFASSAWFA